MSGVTITVTDGIALIVAEYVIAWKINDFPVPVGSVTIVSTPVIRLLIADRCSSVNKNPKSCISENTSEIYRHNNKKQFQQVLFGQDSVLNLGNILDDLSKYNTTRSYYNRYWNTRIL